MPRDEGENNAEDGDTESEDWDPSPGEWSGCEKGELRSHKPNLIPQ